MMKIYSTIFKSVCVYLALSTAVCVVTMDTVLEQQRRLHEEWKRVEDAPHEGDDPKEEQCMYEHVICQASV